MSQSGVLLSRNYIEVAMVYCAECPHARLMARPRRARRPAKRHVAKSYPKCMEIIKIRLRFIRRRTFIIKYQRTTCFKTTVWFLVDVINCFVPFLYTFLPNDDASIFLTKPFQCIFNKANKEKVFVHTTSRQLIDMLYGQLHYPCAFVRTDWINSSLLCFIKLI